MIKANAGKVRGKYPNAYFNVGEEIKIPRKLAADDAALQGRQTKKKQLLHIMKMRKGEQKKQDKEQRQKLINLRSLLKVTMVTM